MADRFPHVVRARFRAVGPLPLSEPFADATMGPFRSFSFAALELENRDGVVAEGFIFGSGLPILEEKLLPVLLSAEERPYSEIWSDLFWSIRNDGFRSQSASCLGQLDHVVHGLFARADGLPLHRFWGATGDEALVYGSGCGVGTSDETLVAEMQAYRDAGYRIVKMKVGTDRASRPEHDLRRVGLAREVLGPDIRLAVDANQSFSVDGAVAFSEGLAGFDVHWFEEPVHSGALHEIESLCERSAVPIAYGESEKSSKVFPSLIDTGIAQLQPIVGYQAGVHEWFEGWDLSCKRGIGFSSGGFSHTAAQAVAACGKGAWTEYLVPIMKSYLPFCRRYPEVKDGIFILDRKPGMSIEFNWEKVRKDGILQQDKEWTIESFSGTAPSVN